MHETVKTWIDSLELSIEMQVHAGLCLSLAAGYDSDGFTSTAAELRRAVNDLKRLVKENTVTIDPMDELLLRRGE